MINLKPKLTNQAHHQDEIGIKTLKGEIMNILQKAAEILVESGYADFWKPHSIKVVNDLYIGWTRPNVGEEYETVNPFADTLEGRRQADAIEDWLCDEHMNLFIGRSAGYVSPNDNYHQWRLDRIKWCLQQLIKNEEK